jgi:hypothetical protein
MRIGMNGARSALLMQTDCACAGNRQCWGDLVRERRGWQKAGAEIDWLFYPTTPPSKPRPTTRDVQRVKMKSAQSGKKKGPNRSRTGDFGINGFGELQSYTGKELDDVIQIFRCRCTNLYH